MEHLYSLVRSALVCTLLFLSSLTIAQTNWVWSAGGPAMDEATDILIDASGQNLYSCGYFSGNMAFGGANSTPSGLTDAFITKQDTSGTFLWNLSGGGNDHDRAQAIAFDGSGNIVVTGLFHGTATFGSTTLTSNGSSDVFIAKVDPNGNYLWAQRYGGTGLDIPFDIAIDGNDNVIITGQFQDTTTFGSNTYVTATNPVTSTASYDLFVFKTNPTGTILWSKQGAGKYDNKGTALAVDASNNIYIAGQFSDTLDFGANYPNIGFNMGLLFQLDGATGNELWFNRLIAAQVAINDLKISNNRLLAAGHFAGNIYVNGAGTGNYTSSYSRSVLLARFDLNGGVDWMEAAGSESALEGNKIALDADGEIYLTGTFKCSFDEYQLTYGDGRLLSVGYRDMFVAKYDTLGQHQWIRQFGGRADDFARGIAVVAEDDPAIVGSYSRSMNFPKAQNWVSNATTIDSSNWLSPNYGWWCNDPNSHLYESIYAFGGQDAYFCRPVNLNRSLYNTFSDWWFFTSCDTSYMDAEIITWDYSTGLQDTTDTATYCGGIWIEATLHHETDWWGGPSTPIAQEFDITWNDGQTGYYNYGGSGTGWYWFEATSKDGCISEIDSIYAIELTYPAAYPQASTNNITYASSPFGYCGLLAFEPTNPPTLWEDNSIWDPTINAYIQDPSGAITPDSVVVTLEGQHVVYAFTGDTTCYSSECIYAYECDQPGECQPMINGEIHFADSLLDRQDTIVLCRGDYYTIQLWDSTSFVNGVFDSLACIVQWSYSQYGWINPNTTFYDHTTRFVGYQTSDQTITAVLINPLTLQPYDTVTWSFHMIVPEIPSITMTGPNNLCPGDTGLLVVTGPSGPGSYTFNGTNVIWTSALGDSAMINQNGNYSVSYVDTILGCPETSFASISVSVPPPPGITMIPATGIICPNDSVLLTAVTGMSNYVWYDPAGAPFHYTDQVYVSQPGFYYYTADDTAGCNLFSTTASIEVYSTPSLQVTPSPFLCPGGSVDLQVIAQSPDQIVWQSPLSGSATTQTVSQPGTYTAEIDVCGITTVASINVFSANDLLQVFAVGDTVLCNNDTTLLLAAGGLVDYTWAPTGETWQVIEATQPGTYTVQGISFEGCVLEDSITIHPFLGTTTIGMQGDTTSCVGDTLFLSSNYNETVWWTDLQGNILDSTSNFDLVGQTDTSYYILNHINGGGCLVGTDTFGVFLGAYPTLPMLGTSPQACSGDSVFFFANDTSSITGQWTGPNSFISTQDTVIFVNAMASQSGTYIYLLSNACGTVQDSIQLQIDQTPTTPFINAPSVFCEGDSALLEGFANETATFNWGSPNGVSGNDSTLLIPTVTPSDSGWYYLFMQIGNCVSPSDSVHIAVGASPTLSLSANDPICNGETLVLNANLSGAVSSTWHGPNNFSSTAAVDSISSATSINSGTYYFLAASVDGCTTTDSLDISVLQNPMIDLGPDQTICEGEGIELIAPAGYPTYLWQDGSNDSIFIATQPGIYEVIVSVGNCSATDSIEIIQGACDIVIPNVFSPNRDGINDVFRVDIPGGTLVEATIYNRWGEQLYVFWGDGHWDGVTQAGQPVPEGTYMYVLQIDMNGNPLNLSGTLTLVR